MDAEELAEIDGMSDVTMDRELSLSSDLPKYTTSEKRKLLIFKRTHTEIEWESELLRLTELHQKESDFEKLRNLQKSQSSGTGKVQKATVSKKEEAEVDDDDDVDEQGDDNLDDRSENDDDLFDSDEEEYFSSNFKSGESENNVDTDAFVSKRKRLQSTDSRKKQVKMRNRVVGSDSESESGEEDINDDDDDDDDDMEDGEERSDQEEGEESENIRKRKPLQKKKETAKRATSVKDEMDVDREKSSKRQVEEVDVPGSYQDYLKLQLRRDFVVKWLNEPFFETAVMNKFVRVCADTNSNLKVYLMAEIIAVKYGFKQYKLEGKNTDVRLDVAVGNSVKRIRASVLSNSRITQHEFDLFTTRVKASSKGMLTEKEAKRMRRELLEVTRNHRYTSEEIQQMVHKKRGLSKAVTTNHSTALESLKKTLNQAIEAKDWDVVKSATIAKDNIEREIQAEKLLVEKISQGQVSLNRRNKETNFKKDLEAGVRKRQLDSLSGSQKAQADKDPFVRRETKPQNIWKTGVNLEQAKKREELQLRLTQLKAELPEGADAIRAVEQEIAAIDASSSASKVATNSGSTQKGLESTVANALEQQVEQDALKSRQMSIQHIRQRVAQRLGFDPLAEFERGSRERYFQKLSQQLPPQDSELRNQIRGGINLTEYFNRLH